MAVVHPDRYINEIARRMPELTGKDEIEEALDRLEYIYTKWSRRRYRITLKH